MSSWYLLNLDENSCWPRGWNKDLIPEAVLILASSCSSLWPNHLGWSDFSRRDEALFSALTQFLWRGLDDSGHEENF